MKYSYNYDRSTCILYKYYHGDISIEDITESWIYAFDSKIFENEIIGIINDYRDASFSFPLNERYRIAEFYKTNIDYFAGLKIAIITLKPDDIIIPALVSKLDEGYQSRPFSTIGAALNWILYE